MARQPWLLTQIGQRLALVLVLALSLGTILPAIERVSRDTSRLVPQLDPANVSYCEIRACDAIEKLSGLIIADEAEVSEAEYGTKLSIRLINAGRLAGEREVWAQVRTQEGKLVEGMRTKLKLSDQGPQHLEFQFSGTPQELADLGVFLGF
jgi:hypothetical protein